MDVDLKTVVLCDARHDVMLVQKRGCVTQVPGLYPRNFFSREF